MEQTTLMEALGLVWRALTRPFRRKDHTFIMEARANNVGLGFEWKADPRMAQREAEQIRRVMRHKLEAAIVESERVWREMAAEVEAMPPAALCPRCDQQAILRESDGALWCLACDMAFYQEV